MSGYLTGLALVMLALFLAGCLGGAMVWRAWGRDGRSGRR